MTLGLLVTTDKHLDDVVGLTKAAVAKGNEVIIFNMDAGTKFLENQEFLSLNELDGVTLSFCDHSAQYMNVNKDNVPEGIPAASQYNNATMMQDADRVINL